MVPYLGWISGIWSRAVKLRSGCGGPPTIAEFSLEGCLHQLDPDRPVEECLYQRYLELINESHQRSRADGIEYPEVVIEEIWREIVLDCRRVGYQPPMTEATIDTAYRWAYFFDASLQQNYLYPGIERALEALSRAGIKTSSGRICPGDRYFKP